MDAVMVDCSGILLWHIHHFGVSQVDIIVGETAEQGIDWLTRE